jgi:hypothetical protein
MNHDHNQDIVYAGRLREDINITLFSSVLYATSIVMPDKGPYNIEISNEERIFLHHALNLMDYAISSIPYDSRFATNVNKIGLSDAIDYIGYILGTRDKTLDDAAGGDMNRAQALLDSLHKKIGFNMNT